MKINILCLYYDIMNLYGDTGNVKVLTYHLKELGIDYNVDKVSVDDEIDFKKYDIILMGAGNEKNRDICLKHLLKFKDDIKSAIESDKFFLITGNALGMFGKKLNSKMGLGIFDFNVTYSDERESYEVVLDNSICNPIYGFFNHQDIVSSHNNCLFNDEGIRYKNFYGTYTLGPILSRNYGFLEYFINELVHSKDKDFNVKINTSLNVLAYDDFIEFKKTKRFNANRA